MLRVDGLALLPGEDGDKLRQKAARALGVRPGDVAGLTVVRRSIDARREVKFVYSVAVELRPGARPKGDHPAWTPEVYELPAPVSLGDGPRPVVVGMGPGGLFAALVLTRCGLAPIVLERGRCTAERQAIVEHFWRTGELDTECNVQFGEGGAGAFSDGKLNTGTRDVRHRFILETLVSCGAPDTILYDAKPHVGTDCLHVAVENLRNQLVELGAEVRFGHRLENVVISGGALTALEVTGPEGAYTLPCRACVLALGHSARDTVENLYRAGVPMERKPFAMGVRIEHSQSAMDLQQYKALAGHPALPASTYKLACHLPNGRSAFSFCVCPGGQVVAAASERARVVTNGMSRYARDLENINGGLLVNVDVCDFPGEDALAGFRLQRQVEDAAFALGGGGYIAPCQRVEDFLLRRPSAGPGAVVPSYRPGVRWCDLHDCLPDWMAGALEQALPLLDRKLPGYAAPDAVLTAVESRSSSPVRLVRDEQNRSPVRGLYPCGEGAGYAGGIMSAAADGMRCAESVVKNHSRGHAATHA